MSGARHTALGLGAMAARNGSAARPAKSLRVGFTATTNAADDGWRNAAACRSEDPETFYPLSFRGGPSMLQIDDAKTICRSCPARRSCLDWAMEVGDDAGILGGTTPEERKAMRRRAVRQRAQASTGARRDETDNPEGGS